MAEAHATDVVIRSRLLIDDTAEFVVYVAGSTHPVGGPFTSLNDAVSCAVTHTQPSSRLYYEALDERGRVIGARMRLRLEPS